MDFKISNSPVDYEDAHDFMEACVNHIKCGEADDLVWLLEHPPLFTAGTSANNEDLLDRNFPVYQTGRGGQYTYHGPGQRICYAMVDLKKRQTQPDIKKYVWQLEEVIIRSLAEIDIIGQRREGRIGIWVETHQGEKKIAAIGVRVRHWITFHGLAINVNPDLSHFGGIIPCGISEFGVTSIAEVKGKSFDVDMLDPILMEMFKSVFET